VTVARRVALKPPPSATLKTLGLVAGSTVGKALGLVREVLLAYFFGTTGVADAFRVSLAAVLVPTHFFMGDVLDGAFVPLYVRYRSSNSTSAARLLRLTGAYLLTLSPIVAALIWFRGSWLLRLVAPGLVADTVTLATRMVRWMGLGVPLYSIAALLGLYGVCINRFRPLALRSAFQNAGLTLMIPLAAWLRDPQWVGLGFSAAFVLYLGFVLWELRGTEQVHEPVIPPHPAGGELRALYRTASPLVFMMVLGQFLAIVDRASASFVGVGAIASLDYARVFVETPHVLIGTAVATTVLSRFAALDRQAVSDRAARVIFSLLTSALGLMVVLAAAAPELVTLVYRRGQFDASAVASVTLAVRGLALSGAFIPATYVMNRVLSAQLRSRESIAPMLLCILVAVLGNVTLVPVLGVFGVGVAMSAAYVVLCGALAARLDVGRALLARAPGWLVAMGLVALVQSGLHAVPGPTIVRLVLIAVSSSVAWLGGLSLFPNTRGDLMSIWHRLSHRGRGKPPDESRLHNAG